MNGKGDKPRNNHSKEFRHNYDEIDWGHKKECKYVDPIDGCPVCGADKLEDCVDNKNENSAN